jgi:hypothetical protein
MDTPRFDRWSRLLAVSARSRRGVARLVFGSGVAVVAFAGAADDALACRRNKQPCARNKPNGNCCSGTCRGGKCRPARGAKGCTVRMDVCAERSFRCPTKPEGHCVVLDSGKPFCYEAAICEVCETDADCPLRNGRFPGKCVTTCQHPFCAETTNGRACFYARGGSGPA